MSDPKAGPQFESIVDGLKKIYGAKIRPMEAAYKFEDFNTKHLMSNADFDAKPTVLLLGQYSTGKTTFIRYLLGKDFPGQHIGPEPTTDRFLAVMQGPDERVIPGNTLAVQADMPFRGLQKFGSSFLTKFEGSQMPNELLQHVTFVDTPGVLSGEKQRIGRSYDFVEVCEWFASRSDLILLLFDAHKLDISDEFKRAIEALKGQEDKVRVVLNKADMVSGQQLLRVYGALMWSLGKVIQTPEVCRVYIGSFWDQPLQNKDYEKIFEAEQSDLLKDLYGLPRNSAVRKVNELIKRTREAKVHALILSHLREQMPMLFGKQAKQAELLKNLGAEFRKVYQKFNLPPGDFPDVAKMKENLENYDVSKFPKMEERSLAVIEEVLSVDIPKLLQMFPDEAGGLRSA